MLTSSGPYEPAEPWTTHTREPENGGRSRDQQHGDDCR